MLTKTSMIENFLIQEIQNGNLPIQSKIPSRSQLCKKFNCSRTVIERAVKTLTAKGFLTGSRGSGTFVLHDRPLKNKVTNLKILCDFDVILNAPAILPTLNFDDMNISVKMLPMHKLQNEFDSLCIPGTAVICLRPRVNQIYLLEKLQKHNIPVLLLNRDFEGFDHIITDPRSSIREGVSWLLIESGRDIGFVSRRPNITRPYLAERVLSFYEAATEFGAHLNPEWCISRNFYDFTAETAEAGRRLFGSPKHPAGIFILDIDLVLPLVSCGQSYGLSPGRDYKLLTFDKIAELEGRPNIAMMKQPELLYEREIRRWLNSLHSDTLFQSAIKTELQIF